MAHSKPRRLDGWGYSGDNSSRVRHDMPLLDLKSIITTTAVLGATQITLARYVKRNGSFPLAKKILTFYANIYSWFSFALMVASAVPEAHWPAFARSLPDAGYLYHYSKFCEYTDVILVTLMGREMDWHWGYHHPTTPYWTFVRCILYPDGGTWRIFAALNALHHWLMYANFAGHHFVRPFLLYTGLGQLTVGVLFDWARAAQKYDRGDGWGDVWPHAFGGALLFTYWCFFVRMVLESEKGEKADSKDEEKKDNEKAE